MFTIITLTHHCCSLVITEHICLCKELMTENLYFLRRTNFLPVFIAYFFLMFLPMSWHYSIQSWYKPYVPWIHSLSAYYLSNNEADCWWARHIWWYKTTATSYVNLFYQEVSLCPLALSSGGENTAGALVSLWWWFNLCVSKDFGAMYARTFCQYQVLQPRPYCQEWPRIWVGLTGIVPKMWTF